MSVTPTGRVIVPRPSFLINDMIDRVTPSMTREKNKFTSKFSANAKMREIFRSRLTRVVLCLKDFCHLVGGVLASTTDFEKVVVDLHFGEIAEDIARWARRVD